MRVCDAKVRAVAREGRVLLADGRRCDVQKRPVWRERVRLARPMPNGVWYRGRHVGNIKWQVALLGHKLGRSVTCLIPRMPIMSGDVMGRHFCALHEGIPKASSDSGERDLRLGI